MEFRDFHAQSIAQFGEVHLKFGSGFHVLYGPNETGKSTLLALVIDFLFGGLPENRDWYDGDSRLWAEVCHEDEIHRVRRKRYRAQLISVDDESRPLDGDWIRDRVGLDRDRFMQLYGFNHDRLRTGGRSLVEHGGDAAISLFEAGGGIAFVQQTMDAYRSQLQALFNPSLRSNASATLNRNLRDYMSAREQERSAVLRPATWVSADREVRVLGARVAELNQSLQEKTNDLQRLQRIRRNLPFFLEHHRILDELSATLNHHPVPELEEMTLLDNIDESRKLHLTIVRERESLRLEQKRLCDMHIDEEVLQFESELQSLRDDFGLYQSTREEILRLNDGIGTLARDIQTRKCAFMLPVQSYTAESVESGSLQTELATTIEAAHLTDVLPVVRDVDKVALRHIHRQYQSLYRDGELLDRDEQKLVDEIHRSRQTLQTLAEIPDVNPLKVRIQQWRSKGISSAHAAEAERKFAAWQTELRDHHAGQVLWKGPVGAVSSLPVPLLQTVQAYVVDERRLQEEKQQCAQTIERLIESYSRHQAACKALDLAGEVPSETALSNARRHRDIGWDHIRDRLAFPAMSTPEQAVYTDGFPSLESAYEDAVAKVDDISDRLRREADRVARSAELTAEMLREEAELERRRVELAEIEELLANLQERFVAEWEPTGIRPKSPQEMVAWMQQWLEPMRRKLEDARLIEAQAVTTRREVDEAMEQLSTWAQTMSFELPQGLIDFDEALQFVEMRIGEMERMRLERRQISETLARLESNQKDALSERDTHNRTLERTLAEYLGVTSSYTFLPDNPLLCEEMLNQYELLQGLIQQHEQALRTIQGKQEITDTFEARLTRLSEALDGGILETDVSAVFYNLRNRLEKAQADRETKGQQAKVVIAQEKRVEMMQSEQSAIENHLAEWRTRCQVPNNETLVATINDNRHRRQLDARRKELEHRLLSSGDGHSLPEIVEEASLHLTDAELDGQISERNADIQTMKEELSRVQVELGEARQRFSQMDGKSADAAAARQDAMMFAEQVKANFNEAVRLQTRLTMLERALILYRDGNQNGVIEHAAAYFRRLTDGRYTKLDLDDNPTAPKLLAIHRDGVSRSFAELSDGTVDQLHLALRLAFVRTQADSGIRLPLIMDDVLVHFDDTRARAAMEVFDDLAETVQIFYFTHHRHLLDSVAAGANVHRLTLHHLADQIQYR